MLNKKGNLKIVSGGRKFTHPVRYKLNTSFKSYGKTDTIDTPLMDNLTRAEYDIKIIAGSVIVSLLEEAMNAGNREALIKLVDETVTDAKTAMSEVMGDQVFSLGTNANDIDGLRFLVSDSPSTQSDVGGIDASATGNDYWRNYVNTTSIDFDSSSAGLDAMSVMLNTTTFGRQGPRCVITTKAIYADYEGELTPNIRYTTTELGGTGFVHLAYTTMPVLFDDNCPSGHLYMIDTDQLWLQVLARGNMEMTEMQPSHDQLMRVALMYLFGNLTTGSRRTNGVLTTIT